MGVELRTGLASLLSSGLSGALLAAAVVAVAFAALTVVGVVVLVRRRRAAGAPSGSERVDAGSALVRLDDAVTEAHDELAFARAQFDDARTAPLAAALDEARRVLDDAFARRRRLEERELAGDPVVRIRRDVERTIAAQAESAVAELEARRVELTRARRAEAEAPASTAALRARLDALAARLEGTGAGASGAGDAVARDLAGARAALERAERGLSAPAPSVTGDLDRAEALELRVRRALDARDAAEERERAAAAELPAVRERARRDLAEAAAHGAALEDRAAASTVGAAVVEVEQALAEPSSTALGRLERLEGALDRLDTSLVLARGAQERLDRARGALRGAELMAESEIARARSATGDAGGRAASGARERLAEAERTLELARMTADPVEALDLARRAATHARDADALARYDAGQ